MIRIPLAAAFIALAVSVLPADDAMLTVKVEKAEPPKELGDAVRGLLSDQAMNVLDEKGQPLCTVWPVKSLTPKAGADPSKGLKYSQVDETTVVGAVKFPGEWRDYRKQKIKPGVYTMRLATQPMDGDHMGTAPYNEFLLLSPAAEDKKADLLDVEALYKQSTKSTTRKHPGVMLLFPNKTPPESPAVEAKPLNHVVLSFGVPAVAGKEKGTLGLSLVVVGETMAE